MVTDLSTISNDELARMKNEIDVRSNAMTTPQGRKESQLWAVKMIDYLVSSGYRPPDAGKDRVAIVYADQLRDAIVLYGYDNVQRVVREWVRKDVRQYKAFPTAGDILSAVSDMLGNPIAEIAKREYEREVERITAENKAELMKGVSEEHIEELKRRFNR